MRRRSEITASIVHSIVVDMVDHHAFGDFDDHPVHVNKRLFFWFSRRHTSSSVEAVFAFECKPFIFSEAFVIAGVDLCVFRLGHWYQPKRIAVAHPTVEKHKANNRAFEQNQNVEDYFDVASLRRMKSEALISIRLRQDYGGQES